jgi:hypothetical protein
MERVVHPKVAASMKRVGRIVADTEDTRQQSQDIHPQN